MKGLIFMQKCSVYGIYDSSVNDFIDFLVFTNDLVLKRTFPKLLQDRLKYIVTASDDYKIVRLTSIAPEKVIARDVVIDCASALPNFTKEKNQSILSTVYSNSKEV